jgi:hypothetical protein
MATTPRGHAEALALLPPMLEQKLQKHDTEHRVKTGLQ